MEKAQLIGAEEVTDLVLIGEENIAGSLHPLHLHGKPHFKVTLEIT